MTNQKLLDVIAHYESRVAYLRGVSANLDHVATMLPKMRTLVEEGRREKVMRWLGFVQGVLWCFNIYTIEEMKAHNKPDDVEAPEAETQEGCLCGSLDCGECFPSRGFGA